MNRNLTEAEINTIAELGFKVFMNKNPHYQTYCFYSDGEHIGYLQREELTDALTISTVHKPNRQTGTGFGMGAVPLTRHALEQGFIHTPTWANRDAHTVHKYKSLDEFLASRHNDLVQVTGVTA